MEIILNIVRLYILTACLKLLTFYSEEVCYLLYWSIEFLEYIRCPWKLFIYLLL